MANEKRLIDANDVYALFAQNGMARLHVADIDAIPRVDAVEVVHGRWLWQKDGEADYEQYWMCSECKDVTFFKTNYCPNCGAKMDGDGNDDD